MTACHLACQGRKWPLARMMGSLAYRTCLTHLPMAERLVVMLALVVLQGHMWLEVRRRLMPSVRRHQLSPALARVLAAAALLVTKSSLAIIS